MAVRGRKAPKRAAAKTPAERTRTATAGKAAAAKPRRPASVTADIARLKRELRTAREHQAAAAEILRAIAASPGDAQRSLQHIAETTERLFDAPAVTIRIAGAGDEWSHIINVGVGAKRIAATVSAAQLNISGHNMPGTVYRENRQIHLPDIENVEAEIAGWPGLKPARAAGTRTLVGIPLRREGTAIGALIVHRKRVAAFTDDELALLQSFADQAVIAIENARSFNETREALARQTATSDILRVISQSPTDLRPVFNAIVLTAARFLKCDMAFVLRCDATSYSSQAIATQEGLLDDTGPANMPIDPDANFPSRVIVSKQMLHLPDWSAIELPEHQRRIREKYGINSGLFVPMLRNQDCIGMLALARKQAGAFSDGDIALAQSFADQALIAIENARLFSETQEALEQQTATADILKVIASSPTDVGPVLETIVERACELCETNDAAVLLREGDDLRFRAHHGPIAINVEKWPISRGWAAGRAVLERAPVHIPDVLSDQGAEYSDSRELSRYSGAAGIGSVLAAPLLREGNAVGAILLRRLEVRPFSGKQIALLQTFADQAVIAIQNVRLFDEVQARTHELEESLQQQTATADVLKVISRSAFDLDSVLSTLVASAAKLCEAERGLIFLRQADGYRMAANYGFSAELEEFARTHPLPADGASTTARAGASGLPVQAVDLLADGTQGDLAREYQRLGGHRTNLGVPLRREGETIGVFTLTRQVVLPFTERQITLVQTFADQAVIAIQNVKLFEEVQARTRDLEEALQQQTATAEVLQAISRSTFDLDAILQTLVRTAAVLCNTGPATIFRRDGDVYRWAASQNLEAAYLAHEQRAVIRPGRGTLIGRVALEKRPIQLIDVWEDPEYEEKAEMRAANLRTALVVPLLRDGEPVGAFALARHQVEPFTENQIKLVTTFADQAVIAIENVRLFEEVQAKTHDLEEALTYQTGSANILKVIASSPTDVQPVLQAIAEAACELCEATDGQVLLREGDELRFSAHHGSIPVAFETKHINRNWVNGRAVIDRTTVHAHDLLAAEGDQFPEGRDMAHRHMGRTVLSVPLMRDGEAIGTIALRRAEAQPFSDKQITLLQTFADQAVIAIGNTRLFEEVQARTRELSRSLEDLRAAQDRLVQTEKLASLGQLTAGIAHEIKNPLNFVNNFSALSSELVDELLDVLKPVDLSGNAKQEVDELTHMLKGNLEKVVQHGKRADSIVKNMLLHSRTGSGEHRPTEINAIVEESLNLAYHGARAEKTGFNITLQRDLDPEAGLVDVYPQEMTRVLLNLISNGFYAATKRKAEAANSFEPTLSASTKNLGDEVEIRVRDNGTGIPLDVKEKMFNPFFTTKPAGEGTGLGLSMSHDIVVKQHQGRIEVETEPGAFTEFIITLPRAAAALAG